MNIIISNFEKLDINIYFWDYTNKLNIGKRIPILRRQFLLQPTDFIPCRHLINLGYCHSKKDRFYHSFLTMRRIFIHFVVVHLLNIFIEPLVDAKYDSFMSKDNRIGGESVTLIFSFNYVEIK